jgi:hypothetical protein
MIQNVCRTQLLSCTAAGARLHCRVTSQAIPKAGVRLVELPRSCHLTYDESSDPRLLQLIQQVREELWGAKLALQVRPSCTSKAVMYMCWCPSVLLHQLYVLGVYGRTACCLFRVRGEGEEGRLYEDLSATTTVALPTSASAGACCELFRVPTVPLLRAHQVRHHQHLIAYSCAQNLGEPTVFHPGYCTQSSTQQGRNIPCAKI